MASIVREEGLCWEVGVWVELEGNETVLCAGRKRFQRVNRWSDEGYHVGTGMRENIAASTSSPTSVLVR
jgi:hypothetical protein